MREKIKILLLFYLFSFNQYDHYLRLSEVNGLIEHYRKEGIA